jgi:tetratricopeptide (TPR) repeat protein
MQGRGARGWAGPWRAVALLLALLAGGGCASFGQAPLAGDAVELSATPFHPQQEYLCGPAALATVLQSSGVDVGPEDLTPLLYIPERQGTLQIELLSAARRHGRLAVLLEGSPEAIVRQLEQGRPVLVLQNLALRSAPVWHYAVVVGYRPDGDRFVLRSGTERRQVVRRARFEATWRRAGNWAIAVVDPAAEPSGLDPDAYLRAAADLESAGAHRLALQAFEQAATAWPGRATALLGQANNLYFLGRVPEAIAAYRRLVQRHPDQPVAVHNLTQLLLERGERCEAEALLKASAAGGELIERARRAVAEAPATASCRE